MYTHSSAPLVISIFWIVINILSFPTYRRRGLKRNNYSKPTFVGLLIIYLAIIFFTCVTADKLTWQYSIEAGVILIIIGLLLSHRNIIHSVVNPNIRTRTIFERIYSLITPSERHLQTYFTGDWLQLIGLAFLWNSSITVLVFSIFWPGLFEVLRRILVSSTKSLPPNDDRWLPRLPHLWPGFSFYVRVIFIVSIPILLLALVKRDTVIFSGTIDNAITLLTSLTQIEATTGALVITVLFLLVELTTSSYSPRIARVLSRRLSFRIMMCLAIISLLTKLGIMSNFGYWVSIPSQGGDSLAIDWSILFTIAVAISYALFSKDAFSLLSPEDLSKEVLKGFDDKWLEMVRRNWSNRQPPHKIFIDIDPLILIERLLITALHKGDINTYKTTLISLRDRLTDITGEHDGSILDFYISEQFATVIQVATERHNEDALIFLCDIAHELTMPSQKVFQEADVSSLDVPIGTKLLRAVLDRSIDANLTRSALIALAYIGDCGVRAISALPAFSTLWNINDNNLNDPTLSDDERTKLWKNDWRLENYIQGYLWYIGKIGNTAANTKNQDIVLSCSIGLINQLTTILEQIKEEEYLFHLVNNSMASFRVLMQGACKKKIEDGVSIIGLGFAFDKISSQKVAQLIVTYLAEYTTQLAKYKILNYSIVVEISMATLSLLNKYPEFVLPLIDAFGEAGIMITSDCDDVDNHLLNELLRRLDQIERSSQQSEYKTEIHNAIMNARQKIKTYPKTKSQDSEIIE